MEQRRRSKIGRVVSDKMDKTVVVAVNYNKPHPIYKKIVRHTSKFKAHNENNEARTGDLVKIIESRPLSREKRWRVAEIIERGEIA
jgi:small subunit ribosomal protein S17